MPFGSGKGALKLKGDDISKKKKKKKKELAVAGDGPDEQQSRETADGVFLDPLDEGSDRRTAAERRHDEALEKREAQRIAKMTAKSHRQRVAEFNAHLSSLTEHMDIPKVGPG